MFFIKKKQEHLLPKDLIPYLEKDIERHMDIVNEAKLSYDSLSYDSNDKNQKKVFQSYYGNIIQGTSVTHTY